MFLDRESFVMAALVALACVSGCSGCSQPGPSGALTDGETEPAGDAGSTTHADDAGTDADASGDESGEPPPDPQQAASSHPRAKLKTSRRIGTDLAAALELPREDLCLELSLHECVELHRIALGEVDAYALRIFEPLPFDPSSAPLAVDRIGLTACGERAARDFADPAQAVIFGDVARDGDTASEREAAIDALYRRLLLRDAQPHEIEALEALRDDLADEPRPTRTWAQLACFAIATSTEFIFY